MQRTENPGHDGNGQHQAESAAENGNVASRTGRCCLPMPAAELPATMLIMTSSRVLASPRTPRADSAAGDRSLP